ncbi:MAG: outer membrane protein assembly factor BamC [Sideroxydans sp.]
MNIRNIVVGLAAITLLAGCSIFERKQVDYKAGAVEAPALEVPPDLTKSAADQRFAIPAADGTQVAKYSDFTRDKAAEPCAPAASAAVASTVAPTTQLLTVGGVRFILVVEPFDRVWRKTGLALEKAGIAVADMDRSKGIYFLKNVSKDKKVADVQVSVHEVNGVSDITVKEGNDLNGKEASRVLDALLQNLEK